MTICRMKALDASFFALIASLTFWFHQGVIFSLSLATLSHFWTQLSAADEIIADLNSSHFLSRCPQIRQKVVIYWMQTVLLLFCPPYDVLDFLFGQGFESCKEHTTR